LNVLNAAGYDAFLYEDFAEEAFDLFRKIMNAVPNGDAESLLFESFNDETIQNYFITFLRVRCARTGHLLLTLSDSSTDTHIGVDEDAPWRLRTMAPWTDRRPLLRRAGHAYR